MALIGDTAPSLHPSLWSGPETGNTGSLNLVGTRRRECWNVATITNHQLFIQGLNTEHLTESWGLHIVVNYFTYFPLIIERRKEWFVESLTCNMLQTRVSQFVTGSQVEVLEFDQARQV